MPQEKDMEKYLYEKLVPLYDSYNKNVKPLIAIIEINYGKFPLPIFNEIRAFNDHIARCYIGTLDKERIDKESEKAKSHIERIILDCYKFLNVALHKKTIERLDKIAGYTDLTTINNGEFRVEFYNRRKSVIAVQKEAKREEQTDKEKSLIFYERAFNEYSDLEDFLEENSKNIHWAIARFSTKKALKVIGFLSAAIVSGMVSLYVSEIHKVIKSMNAYVEPFINSFISPF